MNHFAHFLPILVLAASIGCGSSSQVAQQPSAQEVTATPTATVASPTDVVSQFLDEIRRGGEDSNANELLTTRARAELQRIGQAIQPIGSPDARFLVTRAEKVPGEDASALVHSIWTEPNSDGTKTDFQVVWAMQNENSQWRISGLAMELEPGADPMIIDFENAELMAKLLSPRTEPQIASGAAAQVPDSNGTLTR